MRVEVVPADFKQWAEILGLLEQSFAYMHGRIDPPSSLHEMDENALRIKAMKEHLIVATEGTELLGCAYANVQPSCVYIGKMAVAGRARNQGIARKLVEAAEAIALKFGRPVLELQTRIELVENHRIFEAMGFEKTGETSHEGYRVIPLHTSFSSSKSTTYKRSSKRLLGRAEPPWLLQIKHLALSRPLKGERSLAYKGLVCNGML